MNMLPEDYIERPPRIQPPLPVEEVEIPAPPGKENRSQMSLVEIALPLVTVLGYILIAMAGRGRSVLLIVPMGLAMLASVGASLVRNRRADEETKRKSRAYAQRLSQIRTEIQNTHQTQRDYYYYNYPDLATLLDIILRREQSRSGSRIWERRYHDHDFLYLRLGIGERPSTVTYSLSEGENHEDPQMEEARRLVQMAAFVDDVPVTIPLFQQDLDNPNPHVQSAIGIYALGNIVQQRQLVYGHIQALLLQYATLHSYNDTQLYVVAPKNARKHPNRDWKWVERLPHVHDGDYEVRLVYEDETIEIEKEETERLPIFWRNLRNTLQTRQQRMNEQSDAALRRPFLLVVIDLQDLESDSALFDVASEPAVGMLMDQGRSLGAAVIFLVDAPARIPAACTGVIELEEVVPEGSDMPARVAFRYAEVGVNTQRYVGTADLARQLPADETASTMKQLQQLTSILSNYRVRESAAASLRTSVDLLQIKSVAKIEDLQILSTWQESIKAQNANWPRTSIGLTGNDELAELVFSASEAGVHGTIAGTTGSGKSELLLTLITDLAARYAPSIVNFVLVDFKGGSAFDEFKDLPHCVDIITNLDDSGVQRFFAAIKAELDRRSALIAQHKVKHIIEYREKGYHHTYQPFPNLFIIVDEFAEMVSANPEFKNQLDSITRLGRAIGVSLLLATQRPAGAITDQMRANMKFRICLRVETPEDSREVLGRSDAAYLPPGIPGRGYIQIGNEPPQLMQVARVGGLYRQGQEAPPVRWLDRRSRTTRRSRNKGQPLSTVMVRQMRTFTDTHPIQILSKPWPNELPRYLPLDFPVSTEYFDRTSMQYLLRWLSHYRPLLSVAHIRFILQQKKDALTASTLDEILTAYEDDFETDDLRYILSTFHTLLADDEDTLIARFGSRLQPETIHALLNPAPPADDDDPEDEEADDDNQDDISLPDEKAIPRIPLNPVLQNWFAQHAPGWPSPAWDSPDALQATIGLIDHPRAGEQLVHQVDLKEGHIALLGATNVGKTTFLMSLIIGLTTLHSPDDLHIYIMDFGGEQLKRPFNDLPHVGHVILPEDTERIDRLIRRLKEELALRSRRIGDSDAIDFITYNQREDTTPLPAWLVVIDNYAELHDNHDDKQDAFIDLLRKGRNVGIYFVATGNLPNAFGSRIFNLFSERLTLQLTDPAEYPGIVGRGGPGIGDIYGRGLVRVNRDISSTPLSFQVASPVGLPVDELHLLDETRQTRTDASPPESIYDVNPAHINEESTLKRLASQMTGRIIALSERMNSAWGERPRPESIKILPTYIDQRRLPLTVQERGRDKEDVYAILGKYDAKLRPVVLDLENRLNFMIVGPAGSGRTTAITTWVMSLAKRYSPQQAAFVLVDMHQQRIVAENELATLPHVLMTVTSSEHLQMLARRLEFEFQGRKLLERDDYNMTRDMDETLTIDLPQQQRPAHIFVFIDNYDSIGGDRSENKQYSEFIDRFGRLANRESNLHFIIAGDTDLPRFQDALRPKVSLSRFGLGLKTSSAAEALKGRVPRGLTDVELDDGRGFIVKNGGLARLLQIATLDPTAEELSADMQPPDMATDLEAIRSEYGDRPASWYYDHEQITATLIKEYDRRYEIDLEGVTERPQDHPNYDDLKAERLVRLPHSLLMRIGFEQATIIRPPNQIAKPEEIQVKIDRGDIPLPDDELTPDDLQAIDDALAVWDVLTPRVIADLPPALLKDYDIEPEFANSTRRKEYANRKLNLIDVENDLQEYKIELPLKADLTASQHATIQRYLAYYDLITGEALKQLSPDDIDQMGLTFERTAFKQFDDIIDEKTDRPRIIRAQPDTLGDELITAEHINEWLEEKKIIKPEYIDKEIFQTLQNIHQSQVTAR